MKRQLLAWLCLFLLPLLGCSAEEPATTFGGGCPPGQLPCNGVCADVSSDSMNCGDCGIICPQGTTCQDGACLTPPTCATGQTACGSTCVDLMLDSSNCGSCGNVCPAGTSCQSGVCATAPVCPAGQTACGTVCVDLQTDSTNCGSCGMICPAGYACQAGACVASITCPEGQVICDGQCTNHLIDVNNCGRCGNVCAPGESCQQGRCAPAPTCPAGQTACGTLCVDLLADAQNCGSCGNACASGVSCVNGVCQCPTGTTNCGGACVDLNSDANNCGACGNACGAGLLCSGGVCVTSCPAGQTACGSSCVDLQTDPANCGACGNACAADRTCSAGTCICTTGTDCSGICTNLATDPQNCGACGTVCATGESCQAGVCAPSTACAAGQTDCGGVCVNLQTDASNCGECGHACAAGLSCVGGVCQCPAGTTDCSGVCVDLNSDPNNCGSCGNACDAGLLCSGGACVSECAEGETACGSSCVNLQTDPNNCGECGNVCASDRTCSAGSCVCIEGTDCDGVCTDLATDPNNCGECGTVCTGGMVCEGTCVCPEGYVDCDGTCVEGTECPAGCARSAGLISDFEDQALTVIPQAGTGWDGYWEAFHGDEGTGAQTLTIETTDMPADACGEYALHTTGSNWSGWAGIGVILIGTEENPVEYDASQWTGIRFRAKLGNASTNTVRFNVSTPWTEATGSGGECTGADDGPDHQRCYNHVGRFLWDLDTSWQEYFFCFDRDLYPLFVPSNLNNDQRENIASRVLKLQFQFNKSKQLPTGTYPDPETEYPEYPAGDAFDFWIDDLEFVTDACPGPTYQSASGTAHPFPQNSNLGSCAPATNASIFNAAIADAYEHWKDTLVVSDGGGYRINSPEQGYTPSEAMGYGMMIAAAMGDKTIFDGFWSYTQTQLSGGLMTWQPGGSGSATDADADIAYGLLMAEEQWGGGSYQSAATSMINAMATEDVCDGNINAGSNWDCQDAYNPSYFTPSFYPAYDAAAGGSTWSGVRSAGYSTLSSNQSSFNGLFTDWCRRDGSPIRAEDVGAQVTGGFTQPVYGYDAARVPWRLGLDACANGNSTASSMLSTLLSFFSSEYGDDQIDLLQAGFYQGPTLAGEELSISNQMSFIGPVGVGAMAVSSRGAMRDRAFRALLDIIESPEYNQTYYPTTLGLITLLTISGNLPHP